jgi:glutamine amidotransferase
MTMLHICDYGSGNVYNVQRALERVGADTKLCSSGEELSGASALIIPGVGAFDDCMKSLRARGFDQAIKTHATAGTWMLGICVGMQILATESEEFGVHEGLNIIPGRVKLIPGKTPLGETIKRPHVGWSELYKLPKSPNLSLVDWTLGNPAVYFVHSYEFVPEDAKDVVCSTRYAGVDVVAAVQRERIFGVQFHPEKSGHSGLKILERFVSLVEATGP